MKMRLWLLFVPICIIMAFPLACGSGATPRPTQAPTSRAATSPALSQSPSSPSKPVSPPVAAPVSFAGKTITLIVPSSAGGATDLAGRLYARYLPKYLPGNPVMVVRNLPAGEGTVAVNSFYVSAKPDGLAILIGVSKASLGQLMGSGEVKYDFMKMPVLIAVANGIGYYIKPGIIAKPEDLPKARGIIFGYSSGAGAWIYLTAKELLGIPTDKIILAYQGSADARRAFLAGEINSSCEATSGYQQNIAPSVEKGQIMPIFQSGILDETGNVVKDPPLPVEILTGKELYEKIYSKSPSGMAWDAYKALIAATRTYSNTLHLSPGTPDGIIRAYWAATERMAKDTEFLKVAAAMVTDKARWMTGESAEKGFKTNFRMDAKVVDWFRTTMAQYGVSVE